MASKFFRIFGAIFLLVGLSACVGPHHRGYSGGGYGGRGYASYQPVYRGGYGGGYGGGWGGGHQRHWR